MVIWLDRIPILHPFYSKGRCALIDRAKNQDFRVDLGVYIRINVRNYRRSFEIGSVFFSSLKGNIYSHESDVPIKQKVNSIKKNIMTIERATESPTMGCRQNRRKSHTKRLISTKGQELTLWRVNQGRIEHLGTMYLTLEVRSQSWWPSQFRSLRDTCTVLHVTWILGWKWLFRRKSWYGSTQVLNWQLNVERKSESFSESTSACLPCFLETLITGTGSPLAIHSKWTLDPSFVFSTACGLVIHSGGTETIF